MATTSPVAARRGEGSYVERSSWQQLVAFSSSQRERAGRINTLSPSSQPLLALPIGQTQAEARRQGSPLAKSIQVSFLGAQSMVEKVGDGVDGQMEDTQHRQDGSHCLSEPQRSDTALEALILFLGSTFVPLHL